MIPAYNEVGTIAAVVEAAKKIGLVFVVDDASIDGTGDVAEKSGASVIRQLKNEGYDNFDCEIVRSGDVMNDAALYYAQKSAQFSSVLESVPNEFILCTLHRAENTNNPKILQAFVENLNEVHESVKPVVIPLHPRTKAKLKEYNLDLNVKVIDPVGYFDMIELLKNCSMVLTDSGGLQKEAFFFHKTCLTLRDQTEWVELIEAGVNQLVKPKDNLKDKVFEMLKKSGSFNKDLYGNGKAARQIVKGILSI